MFTLNSLLRSCPQSLGFVSVLEHALKAAQSPRCSAVARGAGRVSIHVASSFSSACTLRCLGAVWHVNIVFVRLSAGEALRPVGPLENTFDFCLVKPVKLKGPCAKGLPISDGVLHLSSKVPLFYFEFNC